VDPACAEVGAAGVGGGEDGEWEGGILGVEGDGPAVEEEGFVGGFPAGAECGEEPEFDGFDGISGGDGDVEEEVFDAAELAEGGEDGGAVASCGFLRADLCGGFREDMSG